MNNKGQSLVLFVILIPLILILFVGLIDLGNIYIERRNIDNTLNKAINYYKEGKNIEKFINNNIDNVEDIKIVNIDNDVEITIKVNNKGIFKNNVIEITKKG